MQIPNQYGEQKEDTQITKSELRKIERAMKKPEFQGLLSDYMMEISDPKNREEYDQYLQQLEKEKELPKGMSLIKPDPHFCMKSTLWNKTNKKFEQKFFINICTSSVVDSPYSEDVVQNGVAGKNWKIPYTVGKIRYDQDKKSQVCNTVDIAFHPLAIGYGNKFSGFQHILCSTAIEAAQKQLGERQEEISTDYKILKRTKCKGGEPALLPIRLDRKGKMNSQVDQRQGGQNNVQTKLQKDIMAQQKEYQDKKSQANDNNQQIQQEEEIIIKESDEIESQAVCQPKYKFIYSFPVDYSDFLDSRQNKVQKRPNAITLEIKLSKINSIKEVTVELSDTALILDAPQKYYLNISFPYPIVSQQGNAKFENKTKILKIRAQISPQYLKEKAQEDLEKSKVSALIKEQNQQDDNINHGIQENFIASSSSLFQGEQNEEHPIQQESQEIQKIQEIDDQKQQLEGDISQISYTQLNYNIRSDVSFTFIIIKVKNFKKENLRCVLWNQQFILICEIKEQQKQDINFIKLQLPQINLKESQIQLVTDYVILKLKIEEIDGENNIKQIDYTEISFSELQKQLEDYLTQKQQQQDQQNQSLAEAQVDDEDSELNVNKSSINQHDQFKQNQELQESQQQMDGPLSQNIENQNTTQDSQKDVQNFGRDIQQLQDNDKVQIQFIDFHQIASLAFEND